MARPGLRGLGGLGCVLACRVRSALVAVELAWESRGNGMLRRVNPLANELGILRRLRHPNVAYIYGATDPVLPLFKCAPGSYGFAGCCNPSSAEGYMQRSAAAGLQTVAAVVARAGPPGTSAGAEGRADESQRPQGRPLHRHHRGGVAAPDCHTARGTTSGVATLRPQRCCVAAGVAGGLRGTALLCVGHCTCGAAGSRAGPLPPLDPPGSA